MCADKALHVHKYVCLYVHKSPTMSPICMQWVRKRQWVMKTPSLSGQLTSPTDRSQGSLEHTQVRSLVTWPIHCSRHVQASPSTVLDSHTHPIHMHARGGRSHLGHWVRSPHYAGVTTVEPRHIHMGLNWKPLSAVHTTTHTASAVNHKPYCFCMVRSPHYAGVTTVEPTHTHEP